MSECYLQHDHTDLFDTLDDGQRGPGDSNGSLSRVRQHVSSHLYLSSCRLDRNLEFNSHLHLRTKPLFSCVTHFSGTQSDLLTSLISLILQPPLPMSEPHWLAGTTIRSVTGGFEVAVLLDMELLMSCAHQHSHLTTAAQFLLEIKRNSLK